MTQIYAEVIGDPIAQSKSPLIHNFWLAKLGIDADYRARQVRPEELGAYLAERRADPDWRGCNVTIPHKQAVMAHLDDIDPAAARIGAVNTVKRQAGGRLVGYNTDADGFMEPLLPLLEERHLFRMARIIGSGGAARAVAHGLADRGFTLAIIARDTAKAYALLTSIDPQAPASMVASLAEWGKPIDFDWGDRSGAFDLVVNTTSLGMTGYPPLEIDFSHIPPAAVVYDIVYAPLETPLLADARRRGHRTVDGLNMLVGQAAIAFGHFFGEPAPRADDAELRTMLVR